VPSEGDGEERQSGTELGRLPGGHHGLSRQEVLESQRERLLAATVELIAENGYAATQITRIAKRAAVANRVFYANFEGKQQAFIAAFDALADHLTELLLAAARDEPDWAAQIIAALRAALEFFDSEPAIARFCLLAPYTAPKAIAAHCRDRAAAALPVLARGRGLPPRPIRLPASTEDSILGGILSQMSRAAATGEPPFPTLLPDLVEFALQPYLGRAEARRLATAA